MWRPSESEEAPCVAGVLPDELVYRRVVNALGGGRGGGVGILSVGRALVDGSGSLAVSASSPEKGGNEWIGVVPDREAVLVE